MKTCGRYTGSHSWISRDVQDVLVPCKLNAKARSVWAGFDPSSAWMVLKLPDSAYGKQRSQ